MKHFRIKITIILLMAFCKIEGQNPIISFSNEYKIVINDAIFSSGELSLKAIKEVLNEKYKKTRKRNQSIRHFLYKFKKSHLILESQSYEIPSDECRGIRICFRKKNKQLFKGEFIFFGKKVDWQTKSEELYSYRYIQHMISTQYYADPEQPSKGFLYLRCKGYVAYINFAGH